MAEPVTFGNSRRCYDVQALLSKAVQCLQEGLTYAQSRGVEQFWDCVDVIYPHLSLLTQLARATKNKLLIKYSAAESPDNNVSGKGLTHRSPAASAHWQSAMGHAIELLEVEVLDSVLTSEASEHFQNHPSRKA